MILFERGAAYTVRIDPAVLLVDVRITGFLSPALAVTIRDATRAAVRSLGDGAGRHLTLFDATEMRVTGWPTIEQIIASFNEPAVRGIWARRVACCAPSDKLRTQLARLRSVRPDFGVFATRDSALSWLLADDASDETGTAHD